MYYGKRLKMSGRKRGFIKINDFSAGMTAKKDKEVLSPHFAHLAFNVNPFGGTIRDGYGISYSDILGYPYPILNDENKQAKKLYHYRRYDEKVGLYVDYLMFYGSDKQIYECKISREKNFNAVKNLTFGKPPLCVSYTYNGKDVVIFSCDNVMKLYDGEEVIEITDAPIITSMCIHGERLFASEGEEKTSLWFSDDFNPLNWKISLHDAGFIDLRDGRGSIIKVLSFGGYVYAFRNYGISRITAYGDQLGFSVDGIAASSGKIYGDSITICGDRIIYLAEDGFYVFGGGTPTKILTDFDDCIKGIDNKSAKGCYYNGIFYCLLCMKNDNRLEKVLLVYDVHNGNFCLSNHLNIVDFTLLEGENDCKLLFVCENRENLGELSDGAGYFGIPLPKIWKSGDCDLGFSGEKTITGISLVTKTPVIVSVKSENEEQTLHFDGKKGISYLPLSVKGDMFNFEIKCDYHGMAVSGLKINYEYFER